MSLLPRTFLSNHHPASSQPLFRLLDGFESYARERCIINDQNHLRGDSVMQSFSPKFDLRELGDSYELQGELPGVNQADVEIEFADSSTITVRGHTERAYTAGTQRADDTTEPSKTTEASSEREANTAPHASLQATVEDEATANAMEPKSPSDNVGVVKRDLEEADEPRYWVSERSVGEFSRSFTFLVQIDSENAHASMKNGILSIVVPKAKKERARKITIS